MATGFNTLTPLPTLEMHDSQASEKWKRSKRAWTNNVLATDLNSKPEQAQAATLLTVIGEEAQPKITPVLTQYCQSRKNMTFERYHFSSHSQEQGKTYNKHSTSLRNTGVGCVS